MPSALPPVHWPMRRTRPDAFNPSGQIGPQPVCPRLADVKLSTNRTDGRKTIPGPRLALIVRATAATTPTPTTASAVVHLMTRSPAITAHRQLQTTRSVGQLEAKLAEDLGLVIRVGVA
jgi:hypothetical protein